MLTKIHWRATKNFKKSANSSSKPIFLYIPWIKEHGDYLLSKIASKKYDIIPMQLFDGIIDQKNRAFVTNFTTQFPKLYQAIIRWHLKSIKKKISGIIVTMDWHETMRNFVLVAKTMKIRTILIPHESIFISKDLYYYNKITGANVPIVDEIFAWGKLQSDIFVKRGFPRQNISLVGAPKFDHCINYKAKLSRAKLCDITGFNKTDTIILFATQPMDNFHTPKEIALAHQKRAILDVARISTERKMRLIIRLHPSRDEAGLILPQEVISHKSVFIDNPTNGSYKLNINDSIYYSHIVIAVNSTVLLEAALMQKYIIATKYLEFEQISQDLKIHTVTNYQELSRRIDEIVAGKVDIAHDPLLLWIKDVLLNGKIDGLASKRIVKALEEFAVKN